MSAYLQNVKGLFIKHAKRAFNHSLPATPALLLHNFHELADLRSKETRAFERARARQNDACSRVCLQQRTSESTHVAAARAACRVSVPLWFQTDAVQSVSSVVGTQGTDIKPLHKGGARTGAQSATAFCRERAGLRPPRLRQEPQTRERCLRCNVSRW